MPPKKRAKTTFIFPVVNKHADCYVGRTIEVADKWWAEKIFSIDDSRTLYIVEQYDPSHQFPQGYLFCCCVWFAAYSLSYLGVLSFLKTDGNTMRYSELENKTKQNSKQETNSGLAFRLLVLWFEANYLRRSDPHVALCHTTTNQGNLLGRIYGKLVYSTSYKCILTVNIGRI